MTASLTRRAALRWGGGMGLGGLLAGNSVAKSAPSLILAGMQGENAAPPSAVGSSRGWDILQNFEQDHIAWRHLHETVIDPDLRGMRSLSPHIRLIIQRQRHSERRSTLARLRKTLGLR